MNYTVYRVNSKAFQGFIYLKYTNELLTNVELPHSMSFDMYEAIMQDFPHQQAKIKEGDHLLPDGETKMTYQVLPTKTAKDKIILFCHAHKVYRSSPYQPRENEKSNIKTVMVNKPLLDVFFNMNLQHFTISNYISRINIIRDWNTNGVPSNQKFKYPNHYDVDFERKLTGEELQKYWQHLRDIGWEYVTLENQKKMWREKRKVLKEQ